MARLIPSYISHDCKSSGEKRIFKMFQSDPAAKDWVILHSLNLANHTKRLYGEIDFLVLIPGKGIYVLEVKSGDVSFKGGVWQFKDRHGNINTKTVGPFAQARDAMFSLKDAINKNFGSNHVLSKLAFGFGAAFTDILFNQISVEYEQWQIFDRMDMKNPISLYFERLSRHTIAKLSSQRWFDPVKSLPTIADIQQLADFLRGDFERIRSLEERLADFDREAKFYTEEQFKLLDAILDNPRIVIRGGAGTGKTMIAMESAIRSAAEGKIVFLTCYNRLIGSWMAKQLEGIPGIIVKSIHQFLVEKTKGFDYEKGGMNDDDFYNSYLPGIAKEMFEQGIFKKFDKIIIDEGQDLLRPEYLDLFEQMLIGGLNNGNCEIYGDFEKQAIYSNLKPPQMFDLLQAKGHFFRCQLKINCRNTSEIGRETARMSGFENAPYTLNILEGIPVDYRFCTDKEDEWIKLEATIEEITSKGVSHEKITILSPIKMEHSVAGKLKSIQISNLNQAKEHVIMADKVLFSTIQAFKGLESHYVILCDIKQLSSDEARSLLYVGMSRAKFGLIVFLPKSLENEYYHILSQQID